MTVTAYATAPPPAPARPAGSYRMATSKQRATSIPEDVLTRIAPILQRRRLERSQFCVDIVRSYTLGEFDPNEVKLPRYLEESQRGYGSKPIQYRLDDAAFAEFVDRIALNAQDPSKNNRATNKPWNAAQIITAGMQLACTEAWRDLPF